MSALEIAENLGGETEKMTRLCQVIAELVMTIPTGDMPTADHEIVSRILSMCRLGEDLADKIDVMVIEELLPAVSPSRDKGRAS